MWPLRDRFVAAVASQLEFSETGEFCKAVRAKDEGESLDLPSAQYKQLKADTERSKTQDGPVKGEDAQVKQEAEEGDVKMEEDDDDDDEAGGSGRAGHDLLRERSASGGLGAVLDIVRNRGMLLEEKESSGRMFDQKGAGLHAYEDDGEETSFNLSVRTHSSAPPDCPCRTNRSPTADNATGGRRGHVAG